jgi:hypothetical protein
MVHKGHFYREIMMAIEKIRYAVSATVGALGLFVFASPGYSQSVAAVNTDSFVISSHPDVSDEALIVPFYINVPEEALVDLRQRIAATCWLDRETVTDARWATGQGR